MTLLNNWQDMSRSVMKVKTAAHLQRNKNPSVINTLSKIWII